jgi:hypothetical protein
MSAREKAMLGSIIDFEGLLKPQKKCPRCGWGFITAGSRHDKKPWFSSCSKIRHVHFTCDHDRCQATWCERVPEDYDL